LPRPLRPLLDHVGDGLCILGEPCIELTQQGTLEGRRHHQGKTTEGEAQDRHQGERELEVK